MPTRFCVVPDAIRADGTIDDCHAYFSPEDPELPISLGRTGIESTPVFETEMTFAQLLERGFPDDAVKTDERVNAARGYPVGPESDPFGM
jgi:hypothetical protein